MDSLEPEAVEPLLRGRLGRPYLYARRTETTMRMLATDAPEGAVAVADEQTAGRGRLGRVWESPPGRSLLVSVMLRPPPGQAQPEISLVAALALAEAVEAETGLTAGFKWPNDILLGGAKVAGILCEGRGGGVVAGIGVNVGQAEDEMPPAARLPATSLRLAAGREIGRPALLATLLHRLEARYDEWLAAGLGPVVAELAARDVLLGRQVQIGDVVGEAAGLAPDGRLVLRTAEGEVRIESGEVLTAR